MSWEHWLCQLDLVCAEQDEWACLFFYGFARVMHSVGGRVGEGRDTTNGVHAHAAYCTECLFVPFVEPQTPDAYPPSNLDLGGPMVFRYAYQLFRFTVVPSEYIGPVLTTLVASKGKEQKNRALSSPKG